MSHDSKARRLVDDLLALFDGAETAVGADGHAADLSAQEARVISVVGRCDCVIMRSIAGAIRLSLSGATSLIDRLVEKKLVRRDRSADDRRVVEVELTDQGRRLHESAMESRVRWAGEALKSLSPREQEELLALLGKLAAGKKTA